MDDNPPGFKHHIPTHLANPQARQRIGTRNMQPVQPALDPQPSLVHVLDPGMNNTFPDRVYDTTVGDDPTGNRLLFLTINRHVTPVFYQINSAPNSLINVG